MSRTFAISQEGIEEFDKLPWPDPGNPLDFSEHGVITFAELTRLNCVSLPYFGESVRSAKDADRWWIFSNFSR